MKTEIKIIETDLIDKFNKLNEERTEKTTELLKQIKSFDETLRSNLITGVLIFINDLPKDVDVYISFDVVKYNEYTPKEYILTDFLIGEDESRLYDFIVKNFDSDMKRKLINWFKNNHNYDVEVTDNYVSIERITNAN